MWSILTSSFWGGGVKRMPWGFVANFFLSYFYLPGWFVTKKMGRRVGQKLYMGTKTMHPYLPLIVDPLWIIGPSPLVRFSREATKPDVRAVRNRPKILSIIYIFGQQYWNDISTILQEYHNIVESVWPTQRRYSPPRQPGRQGGHHRPCKLVLLRPRSPGRSSDWEEWWKLFT